MTFFFAVDGTSVTNTIINDFGAPMTCTTGLTPAPGGVLPPVSEVINGEQSAFASGEIHAGTTTQTVTDVPPGTYVVLATCVDVGWTGMWVSDYPGIESELALFPVDAFAVQQASTVVTIPAGGSALPAPSSQNPIFGSS